MRLARMIQAVDVHACGEPGRVIVGGVLDVPGATMFDKMQPPRATTATACGSVMLREPRGYPAANCNLILPPTHPEADAGYVIMEQVEYPGMSGTNTICVVTVLLETGMLPMHEPVTELDARGAGRASSACGPTCAGGKVTGVTFRNVPAFAAYLDAPIEVPHARHGDGRRRLRRHVLRHRRREALGLRLTPDEGRDITRVTEMIKAAAARAAAGRPSRSSPASPASRSRSCPGRPTIRATRAATS